jgi:hypothetical protein
MLRDDATDRQWVAERSVSGLETEVLVNDRPRRFTQRSANLKSLTWRNETNFWQAIARPSLSSMLPAKPSIRFKRGRIVGRPRYDAGGSLGRIGGRPVVTPKRCASGRSSLGPSTPKVVKPIWCLLGVGPGLRFSKFGHAAPNPSVYDAGMVTKPDYYIATFDTGERPYPWRWELRRHSSPMGVRVSRSGYQSQAAAEYAGKQALDDFLRALAQEERRGDRTL